MSDLSGFDSDFQSLTGFCPMPWQRRLYREHFLKGQLPAALDLPTGLAKTSVMVLWYLAAVAGAPVPRRLVYVVDRRAVVDQASAIAVDIAEKATERPVHVSTLRGQHVDNRNWLADPAGLAIVVGTVDMIGSRLLFSGYRVGSGMRPYHAGLLGVDTLLVLDEAHLVPPFQKLLQGIAGGADRFGPRHTLGMPDLPPFRLISLSATGRSLDGDLFRLDDEDLRHIVVKQRLCAGKTAKIVCVDSAALVKTLAEHAWRLAGQRSGSGRCIVFCDRRDTAEKVKEALTKKEPPSQVELFVGGRRIREREDAARKLEELGFIAGKTGTIVGPRFLVATSAAEVGVDLDADDMVCDVVAWERMVQRFGRVNRRGDGHAYIVIVDADTETEPKAKKPEAPTAAETQKIAAYRRRSTVKTLLREKLSGDVSPGRLMDASRDPKLRPLIAEATTPAPLYPALTRPLVDAWSMTSLDHHPGRPDRVEPWLRGWIDDDPPQTTVVWRRHLPVRTQGESETDAEVTAFFNAASPHVSEELETESYRARDWLIERASKVVKLGGKQSDDTNADQDATTLNPRDIAVIVLGVKGDRVGQFTVDELAAASDARTKENKERILRIVAYATLIIDARFGGLRDGLLADDDLSTARAADDGQPWLGDTTDDPPAVGFRIRRETPSDDAKPSGRGVHRFAIRRSEEGEDLELLIVEGGGSEERRAVGPAQTLLAHQCWVETRMLAIADRLGLTGHDRDALAIAARLHDQGKGTERWQRAFNAPAQGGPYAKTEGPVNVKRLDSYRHEFGSLPFAEADAAFQALPPAHQDLVLHLIAAHHGYARPVIGADGCDDAPPTALAARTRDVALRFARLQRQWGPWGLAWWETLLRAADQWASRDNDNPASRGEIE